jgi:hypothetical protein
MYIYAPFSAKLNWVMNMNRFIDIYDKSLYRMECIDLDLWPYQIKISMGNLDFWMYQSTKLFVNQVDRFLLI